MPTSVPGSIAAKSSNWQHVVAVALLAVGCTAPEPPKPVEPETTNIVVAEFDHFGGRLVFIDSSGARISNLTPAREKLTTDREPAWSPNGQFIAYTSNRGQANKRRVAVYVAQVKADATPRMVIPAMPGLRDVSWAPDGQSLLFCAAAGETLSVFQQKVRIDNRVVIAVEKPKQLLPAHEYAALMPSLSSKGDLAFVAYSEQAQTMRLHIRTSDGKEITPSDGLVSYPAWSPKGDRLAYSVIVERGDSKSTPDSDIVVSDAVGKVLFAVSEPLSDQTGPVWSGDGAVIYSTSTYRSAKTGRPMMSTITAVDLTAKNKVLRALQSSGIVRHRRWPAVNPTFKAAGSLQGLPPYDQAVRTAIVQAVNEELRKRQRERDDKPVDN